MMETLERLWQSVLAFLTPIYNAVLPWVQRVDPLVWAIAGGVLLLVVILWSLLRRRPRRSTQPEVLVSLGAISVSEGLGTGGDVMLPRQFNLRLTVSNLNTYAVQVLEVALKTPEMDVPATAEVALVVPPEGSVMLNEPLPEIVGDEGRLNLYFYTAGSKRIYRLQTTFALEPWNDRYKISPLGQSVAPSRQLASAGVTRVYEKAWREQEGTQRRERAMPEVAVKLPQPRERAMRNESRRESPQDYPEESETRQTTPVSFPDEF